MLKAAHPHRSYHNLKAYQTASDLCADLFWRSRSFPARLQNSLTVPLRDQAFRVYKSVLRSWKYRNEEQHIGTCIDRALDDIWVLEQYVLRAREEEVVRDEEFRMLIERVAHLKDLVSRLPAAFQAH